MKKVIALLLALLLVCTAACAEAPNLPAMTFEELAELRRMIDAEIDARIGGGPSMIAAGVYTAGETIRAGAYVITCTEAYAEEGLSVQIYENHAQYEQCRAVLKQHKDDYQLFAGCILPGQSATVSLSEGMVLVIDGGIGQAEAFAPDWAM